ncbi:MULTISPECIES: helix-turn-helix domain-containing protein [unclassified Aureimonas]|uniref:AraC-like ligand-binding domain-containing protein n=1 Tax=unclassified Aureimonas TaxID=2615206 RepID=UPI0006F46C29|nr:MULTISPECIES: helix-turn-helix domain-containing protein [unclassified Aureimonas]KQT52514.1 AraC family transcriptional regulator [Aureimonas sp. Leaf427]KQT77585.1 AraC family transcriptional regulator [Aureimonas sp. Leaf460]
MRATFSTSASPPAARKQFWQQAVSETYFPLDLRFQSASDFDGTLDTWTMGSIAVSRNLCDALLYRRHERHLLNEREESFLITVPEVAEIRFVQDGREVYCKPGQFLIERSHLPYEFSHSTRAALWVLKIPSDVLRARIARPERLATLQFDASRSVGALFVDMLRMTAPRLDEMEEAERATMGRHLVDLLAMAIEADQRVLVGRSSSVRNAHLHRAEHVIGAQLRDTRLSPQGIAEACGISLRYLHQLFEAEGTTVCAHIRNQRLLMCETALKDAHCRKTISEIAYEWGFADQAQFSRSFRARFGRTPSEVRAAARHSSAQLA